MRVRLNQPYREKGPGKANTLLKYGSFSRMEDFNDSGGTNIKLVQRLRSKQDQAKKLVAKQPRKLQRTSSNRDDMPSGKKNAPLAYYRRDKFRRLVSAKLRLLHLPRLMPPVGSQFRHTCRFCCSASFRLKRFDQPLPAYHQRTSTQHQTEATQVNIQASQIGR